MPTTETNIAAVFPFPTLSPLATIGTTPSYTSLTIAQRELTANAYSVRTPDGTGIHGHIVLVTSPAQFATLTAPLLPSPEVSCILHLIILALS